MNASVLWSRLQEAGLAQGEVPARDETRAPWFVRVMQGIAGWIGAMFLLGFVGGLFAMLMQNAGLSILAGAGACAGAIAIFRNAARSDFMAQFGLATSLAGQALIVFGLLQVLRGQGNAATLLIALLQAALFVLVPNYLHRVLSALAGVLALCWFLLQTGWIELAPALVTAGFAAAWLAEFRFPRRGSLLRAGGYGLALAALLLITVQGGLSGDWLHSSGFFKTKGPAIEWLGKAASIAVLFWAVIRLLQREGLALDSGQGRVALAGALVIGAASLKAPGIAPAMAILVIGFANGNRVLAGLGIAALLGYLCHFYYALHATLLVKSAVLAATGAALLAARLAMRQWWPEPVTERKESKESTDA